MDDAPDKAGREARDWIVRLNSGRVSEDELARFKAWRDAAPAHRQAFQRERAFWAQLHGLADGPVAESRLRRRGFLIGGAAMAATAAGLIVSPRLALALRADFSTEVGQMAQLDLPDGSIATLNTDSALVLAFDAGHRGVRLLKGEAEFRVSAADGSFRVAALQGLAETSEARFSVRLDDGLAVVTAFQGQLRVTAGDGLAPVALRAGQQTSYGADAAPVPPQSVDAELVQAWRSGRVIFEGRPFAQAIRELGRYLPERVMIAPHVDGDSPVSGIFSTDQALAAVDALARTQGLAARRVPGVMILIA